jgi:putative membrane protein
MKQEDAPMNAWLNTAALGAVVALAAACSHNDMGGSTAANYGSADSGATASSGASADMTMAPSAGGALMSTPPAPESDDMFAQDAARGDATEIRMARLALQRASDPQVRAFAQRMINDHTQSTANLMAIAQTQSLTLASGPGQNGQAVLQQLGGIQGADFDRTYMQVQVAAHRQMEALLQSEIQNGQDSRLKAFATAVLPTVQSHLQMAEQMVGAM